ncbi:uncharacterized protein VICG_00694 [Vittaforma corneae ATCC 50505]|uniref:Uncharacterized protein n=1 Tax=Vittaforma corneae (strain ATCC 50505) TaxID=993615 RepID=L2GNU6_VITCO|nr:uncharacterized protein VICG_00694 [Vittaforma corneae ATCC 50505]ELA42294.1 hypothetical protein VICG_00694 [Vittaforma corneae ATCC 50505]
MEKYKTTHSFLPSSLKGYKILKKTHNDIESVLFLVLEVDPNKEKQNSIMEVDVAIEESEVQKVQKMYYLLVSNEHGRLFALKVVPFDNKPEGSKYKWIIENFNLVSLEKIPNKWTSGIANVEIGEVSVPMNFEEMYRSRR